jgi:hypothetical protein
MGRFVGAGAVPGSIAIAIAIAIATSAAAIATAQAVDPFEVVRAHRGGAVPVPPRALAVIPERHTGRLIRVIDHLERIDPQLDDIAQRAGLSNASAIQLWTREANVPIYVAKTDATVTTLLGVRLGASLEITGVLLEREGQYVMLASDVRPSGAAPRGR